jgi:predicted dehydrogenase
VTGRTAPRVALVGAGSMGLNHARVLAASPRVQLAAVIDPDETVGSGAAARFGTTWSAGLEALADVDAVVVAAATEYHYDIALEVIRAGLPVLVEKPVCPSLSQTEEVLAAAEAARVPFMCGFLERYNPAVLVAKQMMTEPRFMRAERHSPYVPRIKTGVAWDLLVHDVDLISQLFGGDSPQSLAVEVGHFHPSSVPGAEDVIEVGLRFANGIGSSSASRIGQRKVRTLVVQELDRMIEIDLLRRGVTSYRHTTIESDESGRGFKQATEMEIPEIIGGEPLATQLDRFVDLIEGTIDLDDERRSVLPAHRIVQQALESGARLAPVH